MAKVYFYYSAMNAGKSTVLLQSSYNYHECGMRTLLFVPAIDTRAAARALPPLLKGYLRVGAVVGDGGFVDHQFNTVDVFVVMPVDRITSRYAERFGAAND